MKYRPGQVKTKYKMGRGPRMRKIGKDKADRKCDGKRLTTVGSENVLDTFNLSLKVINNVDKCNLCKVNCIITLKNVHVRQALSYTKEGYYFGKLMTRRVRFSQSMKGAELSATFNNESGLGLENDKDEIDYFDAEFDDDDDDDDEEDEECNLPTAYSDIEGVWVSPYSLSSKRRVFVHYYCALFSPLVALSRKRWYNIRSEIARGQRLTCYTCGKSGATLGCLVKRCNVVVRRSLL